MKLSIIVSILNSHEVVRRQLIHFEKIGLPDNVEIIYLDDGSDPPLSFPDCKLKNLTIHPTNDFRLWTVGNARNLGARMAKGEYLLMTDIDYIITRRAIEMSLNFTEDKMCFKRELGVLDENGDFTQDFDILRTYGLLEERIRTRGVRLSPHPNNFVMKKQVYLELGGYREDRIGLNYPAGEDRHFKRVWAAAWNEGRYTLCADRPTLYMFPNGQYCGDNGVPDVDYNPFGLFHNLSRKTENNPWHTKAQEYAKNMSR